MSSLTLSYLLNLPKPCKPSGIPPKPLTQTTHRARAQRQREVLKISSGCAAVDAVLGGGFETRAITELYGADGWLGGGGG